MSFPGLTNYGPIAIPGTTVVAWFGIKDSEPDTWVYSLWTEDDEECLSTGSLDLQGLSPTPEQVAKVAFILDIEYAT